MSNYTCETGCCNFIITEYRRSSTAHFGNEIEGKIKKAGCFVINKDQTKILLVQSRGQFWGPPKGSLNQDEDVKDGAIREVKEETGLDISKDLLEKYLIIRGKAIYYIISIEEENIKVQSHIKDNDANGIGWFNIDCIQNLIKEDKIIINSHTKILLKKIFDKEIN
jgi:ADP-ribose pyrophosphatase YjhB (NUDIX family)